MRLFGIKDGLVRQGNTLRRTALEILAATTAAISVILLSLTRAGIAQIDLTKPLVYMGDAVQFANLVAAAQAGDPFYYPKLAAPNGQNWLSTAYGSEWIQVTFASMLGDNANGPWLAINNYLLFSIVLVTMGTYFAARLLRVDPAWAMVVAAGAGLLRGPFAWAGWPSLQNYAGLILFSALVALVLNGAKLTDLLQQRAPHMSARRRQGISIVVLSLIFFVSALNANYYMWFAVILAASAALFVVFKSRDWTKARRLLALAGGQCVVILIALLPIVSTRLLNHKSLQEVSTGDRRAFAALANGGEVPSIFMTPNGSLSDGFFRLITPIRAFLDEYQSSSFITSSDSRGGFPLLALAAIFVAASFVLIASKKASVTFQSIHPLLPSTLLVLVLFVLMYLRGALGLLVAFVLPSLRGFDRVIPLVSVTALMVLGFLASQRNFKWLRIVGSLALVLSLVDYSSAIRPYQQIANLNGEANTSEVTANGFEFKSSSQGEIERIVDAAERQMGSGCNVLVLPVNTYPVDFPSGIVSYLTYDTVKPGLVPSSLNWTSGSVPDTLGAEASTTFRNLYLNKDYELLARAGRSDNFCGILVFGSLQDAMNSANPEQFDNSVVVIRQLVAAEYRVCSEEPGSELTLLCPK